MTTKASTYFTFLLVFSTQVNQVFSQSAGSPSEEITHVEKKSKRQKFIQEKEFNIFGGISFSQTTSGNNQVRQMLEPEFSKPATYGFLFGGQETPNYPNLKTNPAFYFGAQYQIKNYLGFMFTIGQSANFYCTGAAEPKDFKVFFKILTVSFDYCARTKNNRHQLAAGPTLNNFKMSNSNNDYNKSQFKIGVHTGYTFRVFNKKKWYGALTADYNINPSFKIGSFKYESYDKTVEFEEDIGMTTFRLGINLGLRM